MAEPIHWHEGLFLRPHHLQRLQRHALDQFGLERKLAMSHPYGVIEAKLSTDALENMIVQFDRLRAVMPSGLYVALGENAELGALDIKKAFQSSSAPFNVSLGVPLWYASRANTPPEGQPAEAFAKCIYRVAQIEAADENTGENPQPILVRRINARLLLDGDDRSDMEVLPLVRIAHATGDEVGLPRQDATFSPPCLVLGGSPMLRDLVRDLASQVEASRKELALQMNRGNFRIENMRGVHFEQVFRLRTLSRFGARLPQIAQAAAATPFEAYLEIRELLGELAALYPDRDFSGVGNYDHDNPGPAFRQLSETIRSLLRGAVKATYLQLVFAQEAGMFVATLAEEHLTQPNEYYLGIRTGVDPKEVIKLVEDPNQFKVMAKSLANRAIWGVRLEAERVPPLELPAQTGLHYFRFNLPESARVWERIREEKQIAIRWPGAENTDFKITLYMTVPGAKE